MHSLSIYLSFTQMPLLDFCPQVSWRCLVVFPIQYNHIFCEIIFLLNQSSPTDCLHPLLSSLSLYLTHCLSFHGQAQSAASQGIGLATRRRRRRAFRGQGSTWIRPRSPLLLSLYYILSAADDNVGPRRELNKGHF